MLWFLSREYLHENKKSNGPKIILLYKCFRTWDLLPKSNVFTPTKNTFSPTIKLFPRVIITDNRFVVSLWTLLIFLELLLKTSPPMTAIQVKHVSPVMYFHDIFSFAVVIFCFNLNQCLFVALLSIYSKTNIYASPAKSTTHFSSMGFLQDNPQKIPNMDVVIVDTYLILDQKIEDTETHHIHNQA